MTAFRLTRTTCAYAQFPGRVAALVMVLLMAFAGRAMAYTYATPLSTDTSHWIAAWNDFKTDWIVSDGAGGHLRVLRDRTNRGTVSEGIGYGMIMAVYANDRVTHDKLWAYAKTKHNSRGLMAWDISSDGTILDTTCATDGDLDMVYALVCADVKWGGYTTDTNNLLNALMTHCVESGTDVLKPGDTFGGSNLTNPSYFTPGYFKIFADYSGNARWLSVRDKSYQIMAAVNTKNNNTGLQPGWCDVNGNAVSGKAYTYEYNACRVPWRLVKDWAWFGDTRAKATLDRLNAFWMNVGPYNIVDGYTITGSPNATWTGSSAFTAPAGCGAVASSNSTYRAEMWDRTLNTIHDAYYFDGLRTLGLLFATGAMTPPDVGGGSPPETANIAAGTVTVNTTVEAAWGSATAYSIAKVTGAVSSTSDLSGTFKGLWDSTNLYVLAEVTDDNKSNDSTNPWDDDSVELYLDGNNNKTTTYDTNDRQYIFGWGDAAAIEPGGRSATGVTFAKADPTSTTYRIEAKVPWGTLGVTASSGKNIGLDVHINDDDAGGAREGKRQWNDSADTAWQNPSVFGVGALQAGGSPPAAPTGLTATAGDAQVALSWTASTGATSYNVKRSTTSGSGYTTVASPTTTGHTDGSLSNGITYYYVVSAVNGVGESANSSQVSATPMGGQVAAPSFSPVAGTYTSAQSVTISTTTSGASIRYTTDGSSPTSTTGTLYSGPVSIGVTTTLRAIAFKTGMTNSTVTSGIYTINTGGGTTIAAGTATIDGSVDSAWSNASAYSVANISGTISSTGDCSGTWKGLWDSSNLYVLAEVTDDDKRNDSTNAWDDDSVEIYVDGGNNKATSYDANDVQYIFGWGDTTVTGGTNSSGKLTGVTFSKADPSTSSYRLEIKIPWSAVGVTVVSGQAVGIDVHLNDDDAGGAREGKRMWNDTTDTAWQNPSLFGTATLASGGGSPPAAPTNLSATAGDGQVALSWTASSGATSYNVKRSTTSGSGYTTINSPTSTSYTNTGLTNGVTYYYVVSAVNSSGESSNSSQASATPRASLYIYADALASDWASWSWSTTVNLSNTSPAKVGARSISADSTAGWSGLSLRKGTAVSTSGYTAVKFWVHGGTGSNKSLVFTTQTVDSGGESTAVPFTATAGTWTEITILKSSLGSPASIKRVNFKNATSMQQDVIYVDEVRLVP